MPVKGGQTLMTGVQINHVSNKALVRHNEVYVISTQRRGLTYLTAVSVGVVMRDTISDLLHKILDGQYTAPNTTIAAKARNFDMENFQMMKNVYQTCMNEDAIRSYGVTPLRNILEEYVKVFPRQGNPVSGGSNDELTKTVIWLNKHSVSGLVSADSGVSSLGHITYTHED
jgi:peptidase M13-like protein